MGQSKNNRKKSSLSCVAITRGYTMQSRCIIIKALDMGKSKNALKKIGPSKLLIRYDKKVTN
jgi:hypothetical protein